VFAAVSPTSPTRFGEPADTEQQGGDVQIRRGEMAGDVTTGLLATLMRR
jgi:hypothetical protein